MKVKEAIQEVDNLKPNMYTDADKVLWLTRLDLRIKREIIDTHERLEGDPDLSDFTGYVNTTEGKEAELIAGEPYAEMYVHWLEAQIDYYNLEYDGFNASNAVFESVLGLYRNYWNRTHMPLGVRKSYV